MKRLLGYTIAVFLLLVGAAQAQVTDNSPALPYHLISAATQNATNVKTTKATLLTLTAINTTSTVYYLRLYNLAAAPTCSSATGAVHSYPIPAGVGTGAGFSIQLGPFGELYSAGLGFCITGGGADNDNTAAALGVYVNLGYK